MKILIVGNMGYVGPMLVRHLHQVRPEWTLEGVDTGYFEQSITCEKPAEILLDKQHYTDIRQFHASLLKDVDVVMMLAAISNDPIGKAFEQVTHDINLAASKRIAELAKAAGVKQFVFASSCSVYGTGLMDICDEQAPLDPLTAYARSKIGMEQALADLADDNFHATCLRFATACGFSDRTRLDLVLNDFVASAYVNKKIEVLSDGSPWRPLIHVQDMARAFEWAATRSGANFLAINAGSNSWNYQIRDLAYAVAEGIQGVEVSINTHALPDKRSYRVDFSQYEALAPAYQPKMSLQAAVRDLYDGFERMNFNDAHFRQSNLIRLNCLNAALASGALDHQLFWAQRKQQI